MKLNFFFICLLLITSFSLEATNIRIVNLQSLIDSNKDMLKLITNIKNDQKKYIDKFKETELILKNEKERIDELKLILEKSELDNEINNYNKNLSDFNKKIKIFNEHYDIQINELKNIILQQILDILKKYSTDNKIDLILDENSYILSSNSINITDDILNFLNKIDFDTGFDEYK